MSAESKMNKFMVYTFIPVCGIFIVVVALGYIGKKCYITGEEKQEMVQTSAIRLEQIKQEVISIDLPLPLTEKELRLTDLKVELLAMIEDIAKREVKFDKREARFGEIADELMAKRTAIENLIPNISAREERLEKRQALIDSRQKTVQKKGLSTTIHITSEFADKMAHSTNRYCDHSECEHTGPSPGWRSRCIHPRGCEFGKCLHKTAVIPNAFPCKRKNCKMHNKKEAEDISIPGVDPKIAQYLQDDSLDFKVGTGKVKVDKIWGTPDDVDRDHNSGRRSMRWTYGSRYGSSKKKCRGRYNYMAVRFENSKVEYWGKEENLKIKTHHRDDVSKNHLDDTSFLKKGMSKTEVYKVWGLPYKIEVDSSYHDDDKIETSWRFETDDRYSHYAIFSNNKLERWGDS